MANYSPESLIHENFYKLESPTTKIQFTSGLISNPPHKSYNMFRKLGLVGNATPGRDFDTAIGKFAQMSVGLTRFYTTGFKTGAPIAGDDIPIRETADIQDRPHDELAVTVFTCPPERVGTAFKNAMIPTTTYVDLVSRIRNWVDHFEFETLNAVAAGIRGIQDGYEVYQDIQEDIDTQELKDYHQSFSVHNKVNRLQPPSRQLASWQSRDSLGEDPIDYTTVTNNNGLKMANFADLRFWHGRRSRARDGYDFSLCRQNIDSELKAQGATRDQMESIYLTVSPHVVNDLVKESEWVDYNKALAAEMGLRQGIASGFVGKYHSITVCENDLCTRFTHSGSPGVKFTRSIIWGRMAMAYGYYHRDLPVQYRTRKTGGTWRTATMNTPYMVFISEINHGIDSMVFIRAMFGAKQIRFPLPANFKGIASGSTEQNPYGPNQNSHRHDPPKTVSIGLASYDIPEKA